MKKKPAWSRRKRITVSTLATVTILILALLVGGTVHAIGIKLGVFQSQSIHTRVIQELQKDQTFINAIRQVFTQQTCYNQEYQLSLTYNHSELEPVATSSASPQYCLRFHARRNPAAEPHLILNPVHLTKSEAIDYSATILDQVVTQSFQHPQLEVSQINGQKQGIPVVYFVVKQNQNRSWIITLDPKTQRLTQVTQQLINSLQFH